MPTTNIWYQARRRELDSLDAIRTTLTHPDTTTGQVTGAGTTARHPQEHP